MSQQNAPFRREELMRKLGFAQEAKKKKHGQADSSVDANRDTKCSAIDTHPLTQPYSAADVLSATVWLLLYRPT